MMRHLLKLVWHRKRSNGLIILEIFFSFLVVFLVATSGLYLMDSYRRPLGFSYKNVWNVQIDMGVATDEKWTAQQVATFGLVLDELESMDEVESVAGAFSVPYDGSTSNGMWDFEGRTIGVEVNEVTDKFLEVMGLQLLSGRWFEESDSAQAWRPIVIDREMSLDLFGTEDAVGRKLPFDDEGIESRIVGVISDFRKSGEFSAAGNFLFRHKPVGDSTDTPPRNLLLKLRPDVGPVFEEQVARRLQATARDWSFEIRQLEQMRESSLRLRLAPVLAGAVVAGFLMLMVGLGLVGVLWQNVTQRIREIGLRRATGASGRDVRRQVLTELLIVTTLGLLLGAAVVVQLPILDLLGFVSGGVFAASLGLSACLIYLLATVCGLYPSWLATRIQPAEALHHD